MSTYHFYKGGYAVPYDAFGMVVLKKKVDIPALIASGVAGYSPLAVSGVKTALGSIGFDTADILEVFRVPAGFHVLGGGVRVTTVGDGTTSTIDVGVTTAAQTINGASAAYWLDDASLASATTLIFNGSTGATYTSFLQDCFIASGTIDILFNATDDEGAAIFDIWVYGAKAF